MAYLYIDSSQYCILGLLSDNFEWKKFEELHSVKSSAKIHGLIHSVLESEGLKIKDLKGLFMVAGPGSYTGMRLSEGLGQVLEWQKLPTYSFYHFDIPKIIGNAQKGAFISKAFKGEFFLNSWDQNNEEMKLISLKELPETEKKLSQKGVSLFSSFPEEFLNKKYNYQYSNDLLRKESKKLFPFILKAKRRSEPFYYRSLEEEFTLKR